MTEARARAWCGAYLPTSRAYDCGAQRYGEPLIHNYLVRVVYTINGSIDTLPQTYRLKHILPLPDEQAAVTSLTVHKHTVWVAFDNSLAIYDARELRNLACWPAHKAPVASLVSVDDCVWSACRAGEIRVWHMAVWLFSLSLSLSLSLSRPSLTVSGCLTCRRRKSR